MKTTSSNLFIPLCFLMLSANNLISVAKEVDINTAKNVALNLYSERAGQGQKIIDISRIIEEKENGETVFYIMVYSATGFALISADDAVQPVLGYSFESGFDENNHSPSFEFYILDRLRKQIYTVKKVQQLPDQETIIEWQRLSVSPKGFQPKGVESFVPLLKSLWDQDQYFNAGCPADAGGPDGHVYVGCVATAMAQVLNYWQHPWHGTGSHSYTPESHPEYGVQSADFSAAVYNFDNMPDTVTTYSDDLAELMYHCAVSVDMDFGPDGSGAWGWGNNDVAYAFETWFYLNDAVNDLNRSSYAGSLWPDLLKEELDLNRPFIYGATDNQDDAGHAWVIDAYTSGDMFHCNWGWGGSENGWFSIDNFSANGHTFDAYEHACVHIYPKNAHVSGTWNLAGSPYYLDYNHYIDAGSELIIEPGVEVIFTGRYKLEVQGRLNAVGTGYSILFTSELPEIGMRGVRFVNTNNYTADSSKLENCWFDYGKGGFETEYTHEVLYGGAVYCENSSKVLLSNCIIRNSSASYGGGIACYDTSNIRIKNCLITNDSAVMGGGIYLSYSDAVLSNNLIDGNKCGYSNGGGIYCNYSDAAFDHDSVRFNTARFGGGMGFNYSNAQMDSVVIHDNDAEVDGGGIYAWESDLVINNGHLYFNSADDIGGAMICINNSDLQLDHTLIRQNHAVAGSAMAVFSSHPELTQVTVASNGSDIDGEAIFIDQGEISIENSILWNNFHEDIDTSGSCSVFAQYSIIEEGNWTGTGIISQDPIFSPLNYHLTWDGYPLADEAKSAAIDKGDPASPFDADGTRADMGFHSFDQNYTTLAGGNINGTLTCAGSPYFVTGNLQVPATDQLVIEPCVSVIFQGDYELKVLGRLQAEGTEAHRINFASADTIAGWQGIRFLNTGTNGLDSSRLENCRITFGNANGGGNYAHGGAFFFSGSGNVRVSNCLINKNKAVVQGGAIYIGGSFGPKLTGNTFENNTAPSGGAIFGVYTSINLTDNIFQYNKADNGGAVYNHTSNLYSAGNTIRHNRAENYGGGLYIVEHGACSFDPVNKSNIYMNYAAAAGLDLYFTGNASYVKQIVLDTFSVQTLNEHFAFPLQNFNITKINSVISQVNSDLYISMTGSDDNSGTSPASPLKTMYMACMKILADAANPHTIHLAEGTYSEGATGEVFPVNWRDYVSLKGAGIYETTIYGEEKNQLLYCYHDDGFAIDSLTFEGGYGEYGGAIRLENHSSPYIAKVHIRENYAEKHGGGIYCKDYSSPQIYDIMVYDNSVNEHGGGIMLYNYCDATIVNSMIYDNFALYNGGGICTQFYSDVFFDSLTVYDNTAVQGAGLNFNWGCAGSVNNSLIQGNDALSHVAGYSGTGGGVWIYYYSSPAFNNVIFRMNHADAIGGGIYGSSQTQSVFKNCLIEYNTSNSGGGIYYYSANHRFVNSVISNNSTINGSGGAICIYGGTPEFTNVTITQNSANGSGTGGALYNYNASPHFYNSILWDNTPGEIYTASGSVSADYCNIEGSYPGTGNINVNPLFEWTLNGEFDLGELSPCIDAGNPDTTGMSLPLFDFAGNLRIVNDTVDMGALEFQNSSVIHLDLKVFLEGPFNGTDMNDDLIGLPEFPYAQPYNISPWNYDGLEDVTVLPTDVVDWALVELRDAASAADATSATTIARQAAFLMSNGNIRSLDGASLLPFDTPAPEHSLFAVIRHRNHLAVICAGPLTGSGGFYSRDFTSGGGQAYNNGQKEIAPGIWGMIAGDADADGSIDNADKTVWTGQAGTSGYKSGDLDLNGQVNNSDKNNIWWQNIGEGSEVPE